MIVKIVYAYSTLKPNQNDFGGHYAKKAVNSDALETDFGIEDSAWEQYTERDLFNLNQMFRVISHQIYFPR